MREITNKIIVILVAVVIGIGTIAGMHCILTTDSGKNLVAAWERGVKAGRKAERSITELKYRWGYDEGYKSGKAGGSAIPVCDWKDVFDVDCACGNHLHSEPVDLNSYKVECATCGKVYENNWKEGYWSSNQGFPGDL